MILNIDSDKTLLPAQVPLKMSHSLGASLEHSSPPHPSKPSLGVCTYAKWKSLSCATLCNPMNYMVHGILQARILEWVAFPFSRESSQPKDQTQVSCIAGGFFTSWATRKALINCLFLGLPTYILDPVDWGKTAAVWMGKWNSKFKWFRDLC